MFSSSAKEMLGSKVIDLQDVTIYHTENPFREYTAREIRKHGVLILSGVNLSVREGELVYLIGRVGSGKSALLKTLYADLKLVEGYGTVAGFDLRHIRARDIPHLRRRMGIVFQDYQLLNDRNVFMNLHYVLRATGWRGEEKIRQRITEVLSMVGLDSKGYKMPFELSGGEQQRLVIARALLNSPKLLLADEPTGSLDPRSADEIMSIFCDIARRGCAVVMSTHNTSIIARFPGRNFVMSAGSCHETTIPGVAQIDASL